VSGLHTQRIVSTKLNLFREASPKDRQDCLNLSYSDRLAAFNLPSLELRRLRIHLIWCYKILFGVVDMPVDDFFELSLVKHTRGHSVTVTS